MVSKRVPLESTIVRKIVVALRTRGVFVEKIHGGSYQSSGLPDLIGCVKATSGLGLFLGLEVKRPGGKPTKLQLQALENIRAVGGIAGIVHSPEEALELLTLTLGPEWERRLEEKGEDEDEEEDFMEITSLDG